MTTRDNHRLPSVETYRNALSTLSLSPKHRLLLATHFLAHKHTITASHLAKLDGYKNYRGINLQYGKLGKRIGDALGASYRPPNGAQASYSMATFIKPDEDHPDWEWKMHGPLAEAVRELTWHRGITRPTP